MLKTMLRRGGIGLTFFRRSVASQRYSSASDRSHNRLATGPRKETTQEKVRATECGGSFRAMVDVCSLCDSVTYPLGSGGGHGYLAESLNDLRQAGPAGSRIAGAGV